MPGSERDGDTETAGQRESDCLTHIQRQKATEWFGSESDRELEASKF